MAVKPIPDGYAGVTPYLIVRGAKDLIEFLKEVFDAEEMFKMDTPDGRIMHAEVRVAGAPVMLSDGSPQWEPSPAMMHVYVTDTDATYQKALAAGATSVREPANQFYGDRTAGVKDKFGNTWFLATHVEDVPHEEMELRASKMRMA